MDLYESTNINPGHETPAYHIFFIPGNPGLISYYSEFLSTLQSRLETGSEHGQGVGFHVLGTSLGGFELDSMNEFYPDPKRARPPYNLEEQICFLERTLRHHVGSIHKDLRGTDVGIPPENELGSSTKVILVGHSVGAYILMELLRRHQERRASESPDENFRIIGGILLFPTVVDIAKSKSGVRLGWLLRLPYFALIASIFVKMLVFFLPLAVLRLFVHIAKLMPPEAAETTTNFLRSKNGVRQALHMAKHEMNEITADKWGDELWGSVKGVSSKLSFYFGKDDHWVADQTRDELIAARGGQEDWMPRFVVDEGGIPHGYCIRPQDSKYMAKKVAEYVKDIVGVDMNGRPLRRSQVRTEG